MPCQNALFKWTICTFWWWYRSMYPTTYIRLTALCPGLTRWASTRKVKPIWILLEQETVSGGGISWAICKSAPRSRQITTPAPHHSLFTGRMPYLPPNQQRQSTEGTQCILQLAAKINGYLWTDSLKQWQLRFTGELNWFYSCKPVTHSAMKWMIKDTIDSLAEQW